MSLDQLKQLWQTAFGDSEEFVNAFFSTAYSPERCRIFWEGDRVAGALYWLDCEYAGQKFAYIYAVATHPDFRGRGVCRRLMSETHDCLAQQGYHGALLMPAGEALHKMYAQMGYQECSSVSKFSCTAGEPVPVRKIHREEFACLRRKYLPQGGVIQEGENLAYLETYASFYAGEDFLLAAAPNGGALYGMELLGNREAAPGILAALGYAKGSFRIPGKEKTFVMFHPLREDAKVPTYFGLVFD